MSKDIPRPQPSINVNIDEWLERSQIPMPSSTEIRRQAKEFQDQFVRAEAERQLKDRLEGPSRECGECGRTERHYINDYICYLCRDQREEA